MNSFGLRLAHNLLWPGSVVETAGAAEDRLSSCEEEDEDEDDADDAVAAAAAAAAVLGNTTALSLNNGSAMTLVFPEFLATQRLNLVVPANEGAFGKTVISRLLDASVMSNLRRYCRLNFT